MNLVLRGFLLVVCALVYAMCCILLQPLQWNQLAVLGAAGSVWTIACLVYP